MKTMRRLTSSALLVLSVLLVALGADATTARRAAAANCVIQPIKPIPPIGCRDLIPRCVCSASGQCWWEWLCVSG